MIRNRIFITSALIAAVIAPGTLGYRLIEGWSWLDAFYMTVITLSTVGFAEVRPLSEAGSELAGQTLGETRLRNELGVTVLAVDLPDSKVVAHPAADTPLPVGSRLIVLGTREQLRKLDRIASP